MLNNNITCFGDNYLRKLYIQNSYLWSLIIFNIILNIDLCNLYFIICNLWKWLRFSCWTKEEICYNYLSRKAYVFVTVVQNNYNVFTDIHGRFYNNIAHAIIYVIIVHSTVDKSDVVIIKLSPHSNLFIYFRSYWRFHAEFWIWWWIYVRCSSNDAP